MPRRTIRRAEVLALRALLIVTGTMPWILALVRARSPALVLTFHALCHQLPERTLTVLGAPMLVCSRCAGVYAGVALGAILPLPARLLPWGRRMVIIALAAAIADVVTQDAGLHPPFHPVRIATGLLLGWSGSAFMCATLAAEAKVEKSTVSGEPNGV